MSVDRLVRQHFITIGLLVWACFTTAAAMWVGQPWLSAAVAVVGAPFFALAINRTRRPRTSANDGRAFIAPLATGLIALLLAWAWVGLGVADSEFAEDLTLAMIGWGTAFSVAGILMKTGGTARRKEMS
ncbi:MULTISPECIES: hypothetical protein [unclassified Streptomyces]|uniref:hypothetical protein n=1 Tax=unclassified Streptomyces TaxID=2593676 RepID=UPI002E2D73A9|nr:hypothetical protein [Streptomyces sp. NBC_01439]